MILGYTRFSKNQSKDELNIRDLEPNRVDLEYTNVEKMDIQETLPCDDVDLSDDTLSVSDEFIYEQPNRADFSLSDENSTHEDKVRGFDLNAVLSKLLEPRILQPYKSKSKKPLSVKEKKITLYNASPANNNKADLERDPIRIHKLSEIDRTPPKRDESFEKIPFMANEFKLVRSNESANSSLTKTTNTRCSTLEKSPIINKYISVNEVNTPIVKEHNIEPFTPKLKGKHLFESANKTIDYSFGRETDYDRNFQSGKKEEINCRNNPKLARIGRSENWRNHAPSKSSSQLFTSDIDIHEHQKFKNDEKSEFLSNRNKRNDIGECFYK